MTKQTQEAVAVKTRVNGGGIETPPSRIARLGLPPNKKVPP